MLLVINNKLGLFSEDNRGYPLSVHNHVLNDELIGKAKEIAKEVNITEFNIVQASDGGQRNLIYFGVTSK